MNSRKIERLRTSKSLLMLLLILMWTLPMHGVTQRMNVPFLVAFESSAPRAPNFKSVVQDLLRDEVEFAGMMTFIEEHEWLLYADDEGMILDHFHRAYPHAGVIFRFRMEKVPPHVNQQLSLFRLEAMDLHNSKKIPISDAYISADDIELLMPMVIGHMRSLVSGRPEKRPLYIIDDSSMTDCNNYKSSVKSFLLNSSLFERFYVLLQLDRDAADRNNVLAKGVRTNSFRLHLRRREDIIDTSSLIGCYSTANVYQKQFNEYCLKICLLCNE